MSTSESDEGFLRTVTPLSGLHSNQQMDLVGWVMFLSMVVVLLPLLPVFLAVWLVSKLSGR